MSAECRHHGTSCAYTGSERGRCTWCHRRWQVILGRDERLNAKHEHRPVRAAGSVKIRHLREHEAVHARRDRSATKRSESR
jgi:hypothetical protein